MSIWHHVVCRHTPTHFAYVCDIQDDGGAGGRAYDQVTEWRERNDLPKARRDFGRLLRVHNRGGLHEPPPARVTIAEDRNRRGHVWKLECGICGMTVEASDEKLRAALVRLRPRLSTSEQPVEVFDGGRAVTTTVATYVTPLKAIQDEVSNPSVL